LTVIKYDAFIVIKVIEILWILCITISSIIFTFYGYKMSRMLIETAKHMKQMDDRKLNSVRISDDEKTARKIVIINTIIAIYFIYKFIEAIYLAAHINLVNKILKWVAINTLITYIFLIIIINIYRKSWINLRGKPLRDNRLKRRLSTATFNVSQRFKSFVRSQSTRIRAVSHSTTNVSRNTISNITNTQTDNTHTIAQPSTTIVNVGDSPIEEGSLKAPLSPHNYCNELHKVSQSQSMTATSVINTPNHTQSNTQTEATLQPSSLNPINEQTTETPHNGAVFKFSQ